MIGMYDDQRGNLWAFGDTYLVNLNDGKRFNYFRSGDTTSLRIWSLCEGRDGKLWIGTSGQGVFSFSEGRFRPLSLREASLDSDVQAIYEDAGGSLWLGTFSGGLVRLQPRPVQLFDAGAGLPTEMASCLASAGGKLWAGYAKNGLFSKFGERFERANRSDGPEFMNLITSMAASAKGDLWIGTLGLGLVWLKGGAAVRITTESGLADDEILAVFAQKDGSVWVGTRAGTVHHIGSGVTKSFCVPSGAPVTCLLQSASGAVWCGAETGELDSLLDGQFVSCDRSGVLGHAPIRALCEDAAGRLWIGTQGKGLGCLADGRITVWDTKAGFPDSEVEGLVLDDSADLWLCTRTGIYRMSRLVGHPEPNRPPTLQLISECDWSSPGLCNRGWSQAVKASDGRLWFATPKGLCAFEPRELPELEAPTHVQLGGIIVNGKPLSSRSFDVAAFRRSNRTLRLPSSLRTLEIEFTVPSLNWPERVRFEHRLDHFDNDWVESGQERRVRYSGLPFGDYQFHVRAKELNGTWGEDNMALAFQVPVPFWRSYPALAAAGLVVLGGVVALVRMISHRRLRLKLAQLGHQQAMERERVRIARDVHDELGSKLTRISYLSELALQEEAPSRQSVRSIAQTIHDLLQTLDEIVWAVDPQNDTLENLAAYLGQYASEYLQSTSVECEVNISPNLPVYSLTAETRHNLFLAFQEALSNALRHSRATRLRVDMAQASQCFRITIQDNGQGFDCVLGRNKSNNGAADRLGKAGNGLVNMRERMANIGGEACIESQAHQGTTIIFSLPIKTSPKMT